MKNGILCKLMWSAYKRSFTRNMALIGVSQAQSGDIMKQAKQKYQEILAVIPTFEKNDVLLINLLSAATFASIYLSVPEKPTVTQLTEYYEASMNGCNMTKIVLSHTDNFSVKYQNRLKKDALKSQQATNPYTWRYTYHPGQTLDSFDAIFDKCGICELMKTLGIPEITPAMCAYDYGMAKLTGTVFTREYTLAGGGPVCDCHYQKKPCGRGNHQ